MKIHKGIGKKNSTKHWLTVYSIFQLTLLRAIGIPARHKIALQSPTLATNSLFLTTRAAIAVQPGCQSFWIYLLDLRWESSSFLKAASVLRNASISALAGLHLHIKNLAFKIRGQMTEKNGMGKGESRVKLLE